MKTVGLKLNIQKTKIMASAPITSWQIDGETVSDFIFLDSPKNWCFWTVVLEKTLESLLDCKDIQPVNPKGNKSWIFIGNTDAEAKAPIFWPDAKSRLILKDLDAGKSWGQEEKGMTEDEVVGWHHQINGNAIELTVRDSEGQGSLACCSPWGLKEWDTTEWLNWQSFTGFPSLAAQW